MLARGIGGQDRGLDRRHDPYKFGSSDGLFNLGSALVRADPAAGVYVAMNGRYFHWNNVRKNRQTGMFEEA